MEKRKTNIRKKEIAFALYTINKHAKLIRDALNAVKKILFDGDCSDARNTEKTNPIINDFCSYSDIDNIDDLKISFDVFGYIEELGYGNRVVNGLGRWYGKCYDSVIDDTIELMPEELYDLIKEHNDNSVDFLNYIYDISNVDYKDVYDYIPATMFDELIVDETREMLEDIINCIKRYKYIYDRANDWLTISNEKKNSIYMKKATLIKKLKLKPVAIHTFGDEYDDKLAHDFDVNCDGRDSSNHIKGKYIYVLYSFEGFSFHIKIKEDDLLNYLGDISDDERDMLFCGNISHEISSSNTLDEKDKLSFLEAMEIIDYVLTCPDYIMP